MLSLKDTPKFSELQTWGQAHLNVSTVQVLWSTSTSALRRKQLSKAYAGTSIH